MKVNVWTKIKKTFDVFLSYILYCLFEGYRWRGFLSRFITAILLYTFGKAGSPEDYVTGPASSKLILAAYILFIFAVCKLIYDYTKVGKDGEAKKLIKG